MCLYPTTGIRFSKGNRVVNLGKVLPKTLHTKFVPELRSPNTIMREIVRFAMLILVTFFIDMLLSFSSLARTVVVVLLEVAAAAVVVFVAVEEVDEVVVVVIVLRIVVAFDGVLAKSILAPL